MSDKNNIISFDGLKNNVNQNGNKLEGLDMIGEWKISLSDKIKFTEELLHACFEIVKKEARIIGIGDKGFALRNECAENMILELNDSYGVADIDLSVFNFQFQKQMYPYVYNVYICFDMDTKSEDGCGMMSGVSRQLIDGSLEFYNYDTKEWKPLSHEVEKEITDLCAVPDAFPSVFDEKVTEIFYKGGYETNILEALAGQLKGNNPELNGKRITYEQYQDFKSANRILFDVYERVRNLLRPVVEYKDGNFLLYLIPDDMFVCGFRLTCKNGMVTFETHIDELDFVDFVDFDDSIDFDSKFSHALETQIGKEYNKEMFSGTNLDMIISYLNLMLDHYYGADDKKVYIIPVSIRAYVKSNNLLNNEWEWNVKPDKYESTLAAEVQEKIVSMCKECCD